MKVETKQSSARFRRWFCRHVLFSYLIFSHKLTREFTRALNVLKEVYKYPELLMPEFLLMDVL